MKNLKFFLATSIVLSFSSLVFADDQSIGCGLGSIVAPKHSLVSTTTANVVDYFIPSQSFGTTSGTSGCAKHSIVLNQKMQEHFVEAHIEQIKFESALGSGESVEVLARTFGCSDAGVVQFGSKIQSQFENLSNQGAMSFLNSVKTMVKKDKNLKSSCSLSV
jgi:hypothetical protein